MTSAIGRNLVTIDYKKLEVSKVDLLILQGSPFCNIDCRYCYLPERNNTSRMPVSKVRQTIERLLAADLVGEKMTIVWHAGEPLALPIAYYQEVFSLIEAMLPPGKRVSHSIQTNGILINDQWCEFFKQHKISVGISVDGPDFINDRQRVKRNGKGTHENVLKGIQCLKDNRIDFHAIAVVSKFSLDYADEIFQFFLENGIRRVGFNIEEIEGSNNQSTIDSKSGDHVEHFFKRMLELQKLHRGSIIIREFESAFHKIVGKPYTNHNAVEDTIPHSHLLNPFGIISVDYKGNFTTFSPELLGQESYHYNNFNLGNVETDDFKEVLRSSNFQKLSNDIQAGVDLCKKDCEYFKLCGGGAPSNKFYENGSFKSTETLYCKYTIKLPVDLILADIEQNYGKA